jgi:hypothetical protein
MEKLSAKINKHCRLSKGRVDRSYRDRWEWEKMEEKGKGEREPVGMVYSRRNS